MAPSMSTAGFRGRISGVVDAQIQGVIYGDVSGMLETGAYQKEEEPRP